MKLSMDGEKPIQHLQQYLLEALGVHVSTHRWEKGNVLPQYLRARYRFFEMDVLGTPFVLMVDAEEDGQTPAAVSKDLDRVRSLHDVALVYVRPGVTSCTRKRLIEQKVPFVIPGNQMYLPMLGIDLRENWKRLREKKSVFSPSTQALILSVLYSQKAQTLTPAEAARRLGYSAMTMTRALDELEMAGIGVHSTMGRERHLSFPEYGRPLWEKVLPHLNTPVRRRLRLASLVLPQGGALAGQSALAQYSMLAEPEIPVFAFAPGKWKARTQEDRALELESPEPRIFEIELWKYDPTHFANEGRVDRLSLYLSLKESGDERVQSELDVVLGEMEW